MSSLLPVEKVKREILNRIENPSISPKFGADPGARAIPALLDYISPFRKLEEKEAEAKISRSTNIFLPDL